jgi:YbgC/YbaW family acyl-CoA thioester hydrolase
MAGLMHYTNYFRFMETAEHGFFRSLGLSIVRTGDPPVGFPRVHAECDYKLPLHFEDEVEIHLLVAEIRTKALRYIFRFTKLNAAPPAQVARGSLTIACVGYDANGRMASRAMPQLVLDKIQVAPPELLQNK